MSDAKLDQQYVASFFELSYNKWTLVKNIRNTYNKEMMYPWILDYSNPYGLSRFYNFGSPNTKYLCKCLDIANKISERSNVARVF